MRGDVHLLDLVEIVEVLVEVQVQVEELGALELPLHPQHYSESVVRPFLVFWGTSRTLELSVRYKQFGPQLVLLVFCSVAQPL